MKQVADIIESILNGAFQVGEIITTQKGYRIEIISHTQFSISKDGETREWDISELAFRQSPKASHSQR